MTLDSRTLPTEDFRLSNWQSWDLRNWDARNWDARTWRSNLRLASGLVLLSQPRNRAACAGERLLL